MSLNLRKLASISTQLSTEACKVIRQSLLDQSFQQYSKGEDDPVTDTDYKVQTLLIRGFEHYFPGLRVIGEQSQDYKGIIDYDYSNLKQDLLPQDSKIKKDLPLSESCLWIDPIDCTRGFINGNFEDITVLIGLSCKGRSEFGVIGTPYRRVADKIKFQPVISLGSVGEKEAYDFQEGKWSRLSPKPINNPLIITSSNTRTNKMQDRFIEALRAKNITAGGSGRKIMMVIRGEADAMIYLDSWTHKWDSCAGEALIKSLGGYFTTPFGPNIRYDPSSLITHNKQGMVVSLNRNVYDRCMDALSIV